MIKIEKVDLEVEKLNLKEGKVGNVEMGKVIEHRPDFEERNLLEKA